MIMVKLFEKKFGHHLDDDINQWIVENNVEVIDVKFSVSYNGCKNEPSALVIFEV